MEPHLIFRKLRESGYITKETLELATKMRRLNKVPTDVQAILTEEQARVITQSRLEDCNLMQKYLEDFFAKYYKKVEEGTLWKAYMNVGHNAYSTLHYVGLMLKQNKPRVALAHLGNLCIRFTEIEEIFFGLHKDVDITGYFPELFSQENV